MPDRATLVTRDAGAPKRAAEPREPNPLRGGDVYGRAVEQADRETGLAAESFPLECSSDWDAIMTRSFVLDQTDEAP